MDNLEKVKRDLKKFKFRDRELNEADWLLTVVAQSKGLNNVLIIRYGLDKINGRPPRSKEEKDIIEMRMRDGKRIYRNWMDVPLIPHPRTPARLKRKNIWERSLLAVNILVGAAKLEREEWKHK